MKSNRLVRTVPWLVAGLAVLAFGYQYWLTETPVSQGDHVFRPLNPMVSQNARVDTRERVPVSFATPIGANQLIDLTEYPIGKINIQRVTENSYWILHNLHSMTMYVGKEEVLLVDAAESLFADRLLEQIAEITDKPVTTLVYSHPHLDHIGGGNNLVEAVARQGRTLRVIATDQFVEASALYKQPIPQPTEIIETPVGYFEFDGKKFKVGTPVTVAHSMADSYVLFPDKVMTFIDFIYPGRLPLHDFSGVQNMTGYITFLRHVLGEDWKVANTGHVNVAHRKDLEFTLEYTKDIYDAWFESIRRNWNTPAFVRAKAKGDYVAVWLRNTFDRVAYEVAAELEPKYGKYPHFELAIDHALKVQWDGFLHYDHTNHPEIRPDFTPITPGESG